MKHSWGPRPLPAHRPQQFVPASPVPPACTAVFRVQENYSADSTGWTVRGSNSGMGVTVQTGPGAHLASCTMGTGSFPGVQRPGPALTTHPYLAPMLKKWYSYTSTPPSWAFVTCSRASFTFTNTDSFLRWQANGLSVLWMMIFWDVELHSISALRKTQIVF